MMLSATAVIAPCETACVHSSIVAAPLQSRSKSWYCCTSRFLDVFVCEGADGRVFTAVATRSEACCGSPAGAVSEEGVLLCKSSFVQAAERPASIPCEKPCLCGIGRRHPGRTGL